MQRMMHKWTGALVACWLMLAGSCTSQAQFTPSSYGTVLEHLTAETMTAGHADGDRIAAWTAQAGVTFSTSGGTANQPVYKANITPSGKPVLRVGNADQRLFAASTISASAGSYTIFAYCSIPDLSQARWLFDTATGRLALYPIGTYSGPNLAGFYAGAFNAVGTPQTGLHVWSWTLDASAGTGTIRIDNVVIGSSSGYGANAISGVTSLFGSEDAAAGSTGATAATLGGDIADFTIYSGALSSGTQTNVYNAIVAEYITAPASLSAGTITANAATSSSITPQVTVTGGTAPYNVQFSYSASSGGTYTAVGSAVTVSASGGTAISSALTGLAASTTYYFKATATDSAGTPATFVSPASGGTGLATQSASTTIIAPNNAALLYSPYNWTVTTGTAKSINAGAYFRTIIGNTATCTINCAAGVATPYSQIAARLDNGGWQTFTLSASTSAFSVALPSNSVSPTHLLEVVIKSTTETQDRWNGQTTAIQFTGLTLDAGATATLPTARKYRVILYGDSITEGVRVLGATQANDTDRNDNTQDYSYQLGSLLNAEIGIDGNGGSGLTGTGSGNVPLLTTSYSSLWSGQARSFTPVPDLVIYLEGTNDSGATQAAISANIQAVINGIGYAGTANTFAGLNGTRHLVIGPMQAASQVLAGLSAGVTAINSPNVSYVSAVGITTPATDNADYTAGGAVNLHPFAFAHVAKIAPFVAAQATSKLTNSAATVPARRFIH